MAEEPKRILGTFLAQRRLGRGGFANVYEVVADPAAPGYTTFLARAIAWREAVAGPLAVGQRRALETQREELRTVVERELKVADTVPGARVLDELRARRDKARAALQTLVGQLRHDQSTYVDERLQTLASEEAATLEARLDDLGLALPPQRRFAIKVSTAEDAEFASRFQEEWKTLVNLQHDHVVTVFCGGERHYVMEFVDRIADEDLAARTIGERVCVILQASRGLDFCHANGFIHRDIKPDNLFVSAGPDGALHTRLGDFGLVKTDLALTQSRMALGTPFYMPPEQIRDSRQCTELSDIYSLGASLYHLVTGAPPYKDAGDLDYYDLMQHILERPVTAPSALQATVPADLEEIILTMMEKNPRYRPQSMLEVSRLLEDYLRLEDRATLASTAFSQVKVRREKARVPVRRRRPAAGRAARGTDRRQPGQSRLVRLAALLLVLLGLAWYFGWLPHAVAERLPDRTTAAGRLDTWLPQLRGLQKECATFLEEQLGEAEARLNPELRAQYRQLQAELKDLQENPDPKALQRWRRHWQAWQREVKALLASGDTTREPATP